MRKVRTAIRRNLVRASAVAAASGGTLAILAAFADPDRDGDFHPVPFVIGVAFVLAGAAVGLIRRTQP